MTELDNFEEIVTNAESTFKTHNGDNESADEPVQNGVGEIQECSEAKSNNRRDVDLGIFPGISNADYHHRHGISSSALKHMLACPAQYRAYATGEVKFKTTAAMSLGTATHALVLEPMDFDNQVCIIPKEYQGSSKAAKIKMADLQEDHHGKEFLKEQDFEIVQRMRDSVYANSEAHNILSQSDNQIEMSGFYMDFDEETKVGTHMLCKYRPDLRTDFYLVDLKTTTDASKSGFTQSIGKFKYDLSAAHYLEGDRLTTGTDHNCFIFICVESKPPFLTAVYRLDATGLEVGNYRRRKCLDLIKECRDSKEWPSYNNELIEPISTPSYLNYQMTEGTL